MDPLELINGKFSHETKRLSLFAKRIGFDPENGDYQLLFRQWLDDIRKETVFFMDNKNDIIPMLRRMAKARQNRKRNKV